MTARIEIWLRRGGRFRWRYRGPAGVIPSNRDFVRFEDAVTSARRAYPGVHLTELRPRLVTSRLVAVAAAVLLVLVLRRRQPSSSRRAWRARSRSASRIPSRSRKSWSS